MKILKHGDLKPREFRCKNCGCEFVADMSEYEEAWRNGEKYFCVCCPDCYDYTAALAFTSELYLGKYDRYNTELMEG